ncbi:ead/Ea22-like family protein [Klebsiella variicola]
MTDITELTAEKLEEIRQRYRPTLAPKCHICGVEMTIQRMSASRITYGCAGAIYDETGCHYAEGRSLADDHYAESRITVVDVSDPDVLAMVEALEKAQTENTAGAAGMAESYETTISMLRSRIAELESRTVKIPYLPDDCDRTEAHYKYQAALRDAAIKVEADSLDTDGSNRNQPGMVVAVHIDVGDFVKFRGQVYEVKETDFDDHDVTLWFVCGEVLKCAAGCQIEVVSAPVEDE